MSEDLKRFTAAMDHKWRVDSLLILDSGRTVVTYRSLSDPDLTWMHKAFEGQEIPPIGTEGRIGFVGERM